MFGLDLSPIHSLIQWLLFQEQSGRVVKLKTVLTYSENEARMGQKGF
jgi:hypothetical protein